MFITTNPTNLLQEISLFLIAAALGALLPSCTPANRVVENPLIATANTQTLDIVKVELSDTATVLHMNAYYRPKNWIVISSDSYLQIPARRFMLTGAEGITPDSLFWMPKSGRASFVLRFPPCRHKNKVVRLHRIRLRRLFQTLRRGPTTRAKRSTPNFRGCGELRKVKDGQCRSIFAKSAETKSTSTCQKFREGDGRGT